MFRPFCPRCFGRGVVRAKRGRAPSPYVACSCGRRPDSRGADLLAKQYQKEERLESLRNGGAW